MSGYIGDLFITQNYCIKCGNEISVHDKLNSVEKVSIDKKGFPEKHFIENHICGVCNILPVINKIPIKIVL